MMMRREKTTPIGISRRRFLAASGAAVLASGIKFSPAQAQPGGPFVRKSLLDPQIGPVLDSYRKAITAMLQLPATDPRNWYRLAFIHALDCPHGNWWFLPWHRGYIGWFEQICRQLSGDPTFALPYWDWTATPSLPAPFGDNSVLNPSNPAFIDSLQNFSNQFANPVTTMYQNFTQAQQAQLQLRPGNEDAPTFLAQITSTDPDSQEFFPIAEARQSSFDGGFPQTVSIDTIHSALAPTSFSDFASLPAPNHSGGGQSNKGVLESQPHDNVHGAVGGFMGAFLSPVDPIFYMHHSNMDRLWDVWTRKQQKLGLPLLPQNADLSTWQQEPFLFYVDTEGKPVALNTAGAYASTTVFNYSYTPGSGEDVIPEAAPLALAAHPMVMSSLSRSVLDFQGSTVGSAKLAADSIKSSGEKGGREVVARITLTLPAHSRAARFHVLLNPPPNVANVSFNDPSFAGTITPFGHHGRGHMAGPVSFDVPLTGAIKKLRRANRWDPNQEMRVQVVPDTTGITAAPFSVPLKSISIRTI
jgi:tyrosinase